jgi:hypothetical protein
LVVILGLLPASVLAGHFSGMSSVDEKEIRWDSSTSYTDARDWAHNQWGRLGVHNNSARFGWKPLDKSRIMIYAYVYFGGIKKEIEICTVNINEYYTLSISEKKEKIVFNVKNQIKNSGSTLELKCPKLPKLGYTNFLYFGGSKKNQQDIIIEMEKVK